jgi:hypothetical protein
MLARLFSLSLLLHPFITDESVAVERPDDLLEKGLHQRCKRSDDCCCDTRAFGYDSANDFRHSKFCDDYTSRIALVPTMRT